MNGLLTGKRIVVTGAARGLGRSFAGAIAQVRSTAFGLTSVTHTPVAVSPVACASRSTPSRVPSTT